jgi:hypothetical protein
MRLGIAVNRTPWSWVRPDQRAISILSSTISVRMFDATRRPTVIREKASMMKHT